MRQALFVLDLDRCTGCAACVVACNNENEVAAENGWRRIHTFNEQRLATAPVFHFTLACNHCVEPACLHNCPANAYTKDASSGAVLLDQDLCMGCRYCTWVCPYEAPTFNPEAGVMEKCTFCHHRLQEDRVPACTTACPTDALRFERHGDPAAVDRAGFPETGLLPAIRIEGSRRQIAPSMTAAPVAVNVASPPQPVGWKGLANEWSLWIFTSVATLVVAWFASGVAQGVAVDLPVFAAAGLLAMGISALHLGRITRVWRAVLNIRRSWVSREVVLFSAFFTGACFATRIEMPLWLLWSIAALGFASMFAMDMVYRVPGQPVLTIPHSAMAMLSIAFYIGILTANPVLLWPTGVLKLVLYLARRDRPTPGGSLLAPIRIGVGLLPALTLAATGEIAVVAALVGAVIGELIDRAEFYASLRFLTPGRQIDHDVVQHEGLAQMGLGPGA
jgi:Fe-S-cluster-containing dehydrogenase component/DMSO reductase anchor subunit